MKMCSKCKNIKTINNFRKDKYSKDGFTSRCKYCIDHKYRNICQYCGKEFYGSHKNQKFCSKKCMGLSNINQIKYNCDYCGKECSCIKAEYYKNNKKHHYCSVECASIHGGILRSGENHHNWKGEYFIYNCDYCGKEISIHEDPHELNKKYHYCSMECLGKHRSIINKGENNPNYKDGNSVFEAKVMSFFRNSTIEEWRNESIKNCNGKCVLTGEDFQCVHHLYSHSNIVKDTFKQMNIDINDIENLSNETIFELKNMVLKNTFKYGLGVCLTKKIHKLFHSIYGYGNNTKEQFEEFKERYKNGEFTK